ncbi:WecB/TagA/CpsF family glycosyltransferase [Opitutus sp. ER46]|uniref:WecB/TagA/CpsF family glycosyltransferase n=1 Tax=Opitutus sp. ER46 TaxID=2161864 RepID=UPI000D308C9C|nr:WecB/TagA/CpsF family glycosyltransferase [Opitutus sp. ER46]PTX95639.1 glycosyltransferase [Opitutus sp. ER46]
MDANAPLLPPVVNRPDGGAAGGASVPRFDVIGVGISALTLNQARDAVLAARGQPGGRYICCGTAYGLVQARADKALRDAFNHAWLTTPDGMPLVWLGPRGVSRVYGPDLMLAVCDAGRRVGLRHLLYGGQTGVAGELRRRLVARFAGLEIVDALTPPFGALDEIDPAPLHAAVARTRPDVIWVGLGTPKQERFMAEQAPKLPGGVMIGVGAAFDFHSGRVRQAPRWIRGSGFEWLFRFCMEPRRLGWRYLRTNPLFLAYLLRQKLTRHRPFPGPFPQ